jgi:hypothetical protein
MTDATQTIQLCKSVSKSTGTVYLSIRHSGYLKNTGGDPREITLVRFWKDQSNKALGRMTPDEMIEAIKADPDWRKNLYYNEGGQEYTGEDGVKTTLGEYFFIKRSRSTHEVIDL